MNVKEVQIKIEKLNQQYYDGLINDIEYFGELSLISLDNLEALKEYHSKCLCDTNSYLNRDI